MRWIRILGYQQWQSWMCLFNLLTTFRWLVTNLFPCESQPREVSCFLVDSLRIQFFWQRSLVTSKVKVTSFFVTSFYRSICNLTPFLVQNLIFNSMDLLMRISFRIIFWSQTVTLEPTIRSWIWLLHIDLFEQGLVRVSNSPYVAPTVMIRHLMDLYDCMSISC